MNDNSIQKNSILVSRNTPIALVVGVAGFLGSNLSDSLLKKGIQVIGVDNFSTGKKDNLEISAKDKDFHLINQNAGDLDLDIPRLDYIFITAGSGWDLSKVLFLAKKYASKLVFVSSIELYGKEADGELEWFKRAESDIAKFASDDRINTRVLRLAGVYGPRMSFKLNDPMIRLIRAAITNKLQSHRTMEFSSRSIYVEDVVHLMIKCMFSGATAMKIFDGALLVPVKIAEISQVLMDPAWHESRAFETSEMPPWPTPNLEKTIKFLSWEPKVKLAKALSQTLDYFKGRTVEPEQEELVPVLSASKQETLREFKNESKNEPKGEPQKKKFNFPYNSFFVLVGLFIIGFGLVWPVGSLSWNIYLLKSGFSGATDKFINGDIKGSAQEIKKAKKGIAGINESVVALSFLDKISIFGIGDNYRLLDKLVYIADQTTTSTEYSIAGFDNAVLGIKAVLGELNEDPASYFQGANEAFSRADSGFARAKALAQHDRITQKLPPFLLGRFSKEQELFEKYSNLSEKGRAMSSILPSVFGREGKKSYLVLLQNNNELRPTGGFIGSFAKIEFEDSKLKKLEVDDIYNIDSKLTMHIEPPKEIKEDLGQKDYFLRDSNWESDFPTSARLAAWFYTRETGERVDGVVATDLSMLGDLLKITGPINLSEFSENITAENLFEKSIANSQQGFLQDAQSKKSFIAVLADKLINKIFFLPNQNWARLVESFSVSMEQKHLMFYIEDPKTFAYLVSSGWAGALPRQDAQKTEGLTEDFLSVVEANLGANKVNYFLDRNYTLETNMSKSGEVSHKLKVAYTNRSLESTWPAGSYKNRLRIYLPFGSKLTKATFGGADIFSSVSAFSDYGRTGYSMLLTVKPKEAKDLILEYKIGNLSFKNEQGIYRLNVIKQAGTIKDPFNWKLFYPVNYSISASSGKKVNPQTIDIASDLSTNKSFEIEIKK